MRLSVRLISTIYRYNAGSDAQNITANFSALGPDASLSAPASVRDLWAHTTLSGKHGSFTGTVQSHGVLALMLSN